MKINPRKSYSVVRENNQQTDPQYSQQDKNIADYV